MQLMILSPWEDLVQLEYQLSHLIIKLLPSLEAGIVDGMCPLHPTLLEKMLHIEEDGTLNLSHSKWSPSIYIK